MAFLAVRVRVPPLAPNTPLKSNPTYRSDPYRVVAVVCLLFAGAAGCTSEPDEVVESAFAAYRSGETETFVEAFTLESRPVVKALVRRGGAAGQPFGPPAEVGRATSMSISTLPDRRSRGETVDVAIVTLTGPSGSVLVPLVEEQGAWRIDLFRLARTASGPNLGRGLLD